MDDAKSDNDPSGVDVGAAGDAVASSDHVGVVLGGMDIRGVSVMPAVDDAEELIVAVDEIDKVMRDVAETERVTETDAEVLKVVLGDPDTDMVAETDMEVLGETVGSSDVDIAEVDVTEMEMLFVEEVDCVN